MMIPGTSSELTLAFEEDDETVRPSMRGKTLRYAITLNKIRKRDMPELNDEFAAEVGQFETVEELRADIAEDVLRRKALETRMEVFNEIIDKIVETSEVQVPDTLINSELDDQVTQMRTRLAQQGISFDEYLASNDQTEADLRADLTEAAEGRVRNTLVLQEVAKAEGLEVTDEDLDAEIEKLVVGRSNPEQLRSLYRSDYFRGMLENELHDRKLMDMVVDLATEGKGAISGPGADLLAADQAPPEPEAEAAESEEVGETEVDDDATETTAGPGHVEESEAPDVDAEAESVEADEPAAAVEDEDEDVEAAASEAAAIAEDDEDGKPES
jgi:trigger factor